VELLAADAVDDEPDVPRAHLHAPSERFLLIEKVLRWIALDRPVCVWLDDVQWGHDSVEFVEFLLRRRREQPVEPLFVIAARDDLRVEAARAADALQRVRAVTAVAPHVGGALSPDTHSAPVQQLLELEPAAAREIVR